MEQEKVKAIKEILCACQERAYYYTDGKYVRRKITNKNILTYINELEEENKKLAQLKGER